MGRNWLCCLLLAVTAVRFTLSEDLFDSSSYDPCECPDGDLSKRCLCVYITNCDSSNYIKTEGVFVQRSNVPLTKRCKGAEKCCFPPDDDNDYEGEKEKTETSTASTTIKTPPSTKIPEVSPDVIVLPPENTKGGCGVRRLVPRNRIYSSNPSTSFGEFPWMVVIFLYPTLELHCGGSLISHNVVLTAAHCVHGRSESDIVVRAGDWDLTSKAEPLKRIDVKVKKIIRHENFHPQTLINDVALLVLSHSLPRRIHIDTICLPEKGATFAGQRCIVTGWGSKQGGALNYTTTLSQVELPVLEHKKCRDMLRKTKFGRYFRLDKSFLCAGGEENKGACLKDGGGPLICESDKDSDRYYQAGVVAGGLACGVKDIPDVYANVAYLSDWIKDRLDEQGLKNEAIHP
ncbi:phenoloxidase-activating factor 2 [Anabrus simplex]|uniref:phenoloxidase-activating factor 2 n=1 Tax=Anabrus simplex TaxID=316456 RepID=UPI0035A28CE3